MEQRAAASALAPSAERRALRVQTGVALVRSEAEQLARGRPRRVFALQRAGELLQQRYPGIETHFYNARRPVSDDLLRDIKASCDVVVGATAD